ncbi:MAG: rRNA maturation RNase YbeY [Solirubrobacteraceae bacterium]
MIELEVLGTGLLGEPVPVAQIEHLCSLALASAGIEDGHLAVEFVDAQRIAELNERHRGKPGPTDVLSFPIDGVEPIGGSSVEDRQAGDADGLGEGEGPPRELGDIVICPEHTADLREAIVHGTLHLIGMDHETDDGEMLALQAELLRWSAT